VKHLLARAHRQVLEKFARSRLLVGLDFDGTLAPIMRSPDAVALGVRMRRLLGEVAARYPTAVISGRSRRDLAPRLRGLPLFEIVGNHGLESGEPGTGAGGRRKKNSGNPPIPDPAEVARWIKRLHRDLDECKGVWIEDKGLSVAVHFRRSHAKQKAQAAIAASVARLGPVRVVGGKQVVNLLPAGAPHKGMALLALLARAGCDTAIYLGDDDTDEDVFALGQPERLLTVRIGRDRPAGDGGGPTRSRASYYLRDRGEVEILLRALRDARTSHRS
jgi:trehalose 6-phosphate phosphatase